MTGYRAEWCRYTLDFTFEARTSRGSMLHKDTYFIRITAPDKRIGVGEVPLFRGLSQEDTPEFEQILADKCRNITDAIEDSSVSSIAFGISSALASMAQNGSAATPRTPWELGHRGIPINGLVWMGDKHLMQKRVAEKLAQGFRVIKIKIGGINFDDELEIIKELRRQFSPDELELRLDANGAFQPDEALKYLDRLAPYDIHSIEQPVKAGQIEAMADICRRSPIPVALDEELIGMRTYEEKVRLVSEIQPSFLVLKPSLCGGFSAAAQYIDIIGPGRWWVTSALESNVGLYAIARWLTRYDISMAQGLGTGQLYSNNIGSPLSMHDCRLWCDPLKRWQDLDELPWHQ